MKFLLTFSIFIICLLINTSDCSAEVQTKEHECNLPEKLKNEIAGYENIAQDIINQIVYGKLKGKTWEWLAFLCDTFGSRMTGSTALESAIDHMINLGNELNLDKVYTEDVEAPHWIRGSESLKMLSPRYAQLPMLGYGGSIATPAGGLHAPAVVVESYEELANLPDEEIVGKIVVYNPIFISYGETGIYRGYGAAEAAKRGAVAALVKSLTPKSIRSPHTGWQWYQEGVDKIPVASITVEDAEMLHRMYRRGTEIKLNLTMSATMLDPTISRNTILELTGKDENVERPLMVISGHLDSWDVGDGAMDDGGGVMISVAAVAFLKELGYQPRRTIRAVLWTADEQGAYGQEAYVAQHKEEEDQLNFSMDSDVGTFKPLGLYYAGNANAGCIIKEVLGLLESINATRISFDEDGYLTPWTPRGHPGGHLLNENDQYFWYHHSEGDSMVVQDPHNLDLCAALWTVVSYVIADLETSLPRQ